MKALWITLLVLGIWSVAGITYLTYSKEKDLILLAVGKDEPGPTLAKELVTLFQDHPTLRLEIKLLKDEKAILKSIKNGSADMAFLPSEYGFNPGIMIATPLYKAVLHVLTNNPELKSIQDVLRKAYLFPGVSSEHALSFLKMLGSAYDIDSEHIQIASNPYDPKIDTLFVFGEILPEDSQERLLSQDYRLLSLAEDTGDGSLVSGLSLRHPDISSFIIPSRFYGALNKKEVVTLSSWVSLMARTDLAPGTVTAVLNHLADFGQSIRAKHPLFTVTSIPVLSEANRTLPLHSGTRDYMERNQPSFLHRNAELLGFLTTLALILASAVHNFQKWNVQVKKDKLDRYYQQFLEIFLENEADASAKAEEKLKKMSEIRHEVITLLIEEKVPADNAFLIFTKLYEQVRDEIQTGLKN